MTGKSSRKSVLSNVAQLRALASPVRIEVVGTFQSFGPMAIRELAERMARPADGLYHHLRQLQKAGIVRVAETRRVGKRDEAVFELTAERFGHTAPARTPAMKRAVVEAATAALRLTMREFDRAVHAPKLAGVDGVADCTDESASARLMRQKSWLTSEDLVALQRMFGKIEEFCQRMRKKNGRPFSMTLALVPLVKRKRI